MVLMALGGQWCPPSSQAWIVQVAPPEQPHPRLLACTVAQHVSNPAASERIQGAPTAKFQVVTEVCQNVLHFLDTLNNIQGETLHQAQALHYVRMGHSQLVVLASPIRQMDNPHFALQVRGALAQPLELLHGTTGCRAQLGARRQQALAYIVVRKAFLSAGEPPGLPLGSDYMPIDYPHVAQYTLL